MVAYDLHINPFYERRLVQELLLLGVSYQLVSLSEMVPVSRKSDVSNSVIILVGVTLAYFCLLGLRKAYHNSKLRFRRYKYRKQLKQSKTQQVNPLNPSATTQ